MQLEKDDFFMDNLSLKFKCEVINYKLSRAIKDLKHSRYNLISYIKYLYNKHDIYNKIICSKYNIVRRFLVYLEFKGIINKNKHNQVNNNNDIEYIKNIMESIVTKYE